MRYVFVLLVVAILGYLLMIQNERETSIPEPLAPVAVLKKVKEDLGDVSKQIESKNETLHELLNDAPALQAKKELPSSEPDEDASGWKRATATVFWVGEAADASNGQIHNRSSAWDVDWETSFGGYDDPDNRCGYRPCGFAPRLNAFYIALPYNDIDEEGNRKAQSRMVSWFDENRAGTQLEGRWVEVRANGRSCFGQWYDVGPFGEDDFAYVFGSSSDPASRIGERAGIDVSPALRDCLGLDGLDTVMWRHVDGPTAGPWARTQ